MPETETDLNETLDRVLGMVVRRRWWILTAACATALATMAVVSLLPNRFSSEATLIVVQQQVPERYVTPTTTTAISDALQAMTQEVLSRSRLLGIIEDFGLYVKERKHRAPEEVIELMRRSIEIKPVDVVPGQKDFNTFKISFTADNPHMAEEVTGRLTALFIEENVKTRADQATNTTNFLGEQLAAAKVKLEAQERLLREYKMQHLGELPEQEAGNLAILSGLQGQLQNTTAALSRAQQQRAYLESLLGGYRSAVSRGATIPAVSGASHVVTPIDVAQSELAHLRSEREKLLGSYTPQHPDVVKLDQEIAQKQAELARLKSVKPARTEDVQTSSAPVAGAEEDASLAQFKSQLVANRLEIDNLTKDEKRLKTAIEEYQNRLNATPIREQQLSGILRDYELTKRDYADLLSKQTQSELSTSLEKRQEGQHFRLVDPPSLPTVPSSPQRAKISLGGAAAGLFLGLALAFFKENKDSAFHSEKELSHNFSLPLVLGLPLLLTPAQERGRARKRVFELVAGCIMVLVVCAAEFYVYRHG